MVIALARPRIAHRFALLVFTSFAAIAAWAWWTQTDCGCFGSRTPKGVPLIVDLVAVGLLLICHRELPERKVREDSGNRRRLISPVGIGIAAGFLAAGGTMWQIERIGGGDQTPTWFGDNLIGMRFPLLGEEKFATVMPVTGDMLVVMLRPDCEHCREVAAHWAMIEAGRRETLNVIGISVADGRWMVMPNAISPTRLGADNEFAISWEAAEEPFIAAPTFIAVQDRVVIAVATGDDASQLMNTDNWIRALFGAADE